MPTRPPYQHDRKNHLPQLAGGFLICRKVFPEKGVEHARLLLLLLQKRMLVGKLGLDVQADEGQFLLRFLRANIDRSRPRKDDVQLDFLKGPF